MTNVYDKGNISKGQSEAVNLERTDKTINNIKKSK